MNDFHLVFWNLDMSFFTSFGLIFLLNGYCLPLNNKCTSYDLKILIWWVLLCYSSITFHVLIWVYFILSQYPMLLQLSFVGYGLGNISRFFFPRSSKNTSLEFSIFEFLLAKRFVLLLVKNVLHVSSSDSLPWYCFFFLCFSIIKWIILITKKKEYIANSWRKK